MQKIVVVESGSFAVFDGPQAGGLSITAFKSDGTIDKITEEFEVAMDSEKLDELRKKKDLKSITKGKLKQIYKRGLIPSEDKRRDDDAKSIVSLKVG